MNKSPEQRKAKRLNHRGTIMLTDKASGYYSYALVTNVSGEGMYFVSEYAFQPGKEVDIRLDNPPFKSAPNDYHAIVCWCRLVSEDDSIDLYGVGVKYTDSI